MAKGMDIDTQRAMLIYPDGHDPVAFLDRVITVSYLMMHCFVTALISGSDLYEIMEDFQ